MNFHGYGHYSDHVGETIRVAAVTKPKPSPDQLEDLLRRLLANMAAPVPVLAPVQEVPLVAKLRQRLVAEIQSRQPAAVTKPKPPPDQLEDQLRWLLSNRADPVPVPAPVPLVPTVNKLLQRLVAETQSRQPVAVSSPELWGSDRPSPFGGYRSEGIGMASDVFHAENQVILQPVAPLWMNRFCLCYQDGERNQ